MLPPPGPFPPSLPAARGAAYGEAMAGRVRRCAYVNCSKPLPEGSRSDKQFCDRKCKIAHLRWRRHQAEAFAIGLAFICGEKPEQVVRCPVCGHRFALGHGHRKRQDLRSGGVPSGRLPGPPPGRGGTRSRYAGQHPKTPPQAADQAG
jgi:hypothetical protein